MIPLHLKLSGFLSYRDPIEVDFTGFELACISGYNGAGKSSLLDAITWALFGQARGKSEEVINLHPEVKAAEVSLTFYYEGNLYRVIRILPRGKSTLLEFQIAETKVENEAIGNQAIFQSLPSDGTKWRPLTEHTKSETEKRIVSTLRMDYDTFVNASFFLQGKADQFTQQNAAQRKQILGSILGLEIWETYRARAAERRKSLEVKIENIAGRLFEIENELEEEAGRKARLAELEASLEQLTASRKMQEAALEAIKHASAALENQKKLTETLAATLERSQSHLSSMAVRLTAKEAERNSYLDLLNRAASVETAYQAWQQARANLSRMDEIAAQFREQDQKRQPLLEAIAIEKARLEQELEALRNQQSTFNAQAPVVEQLQKEVVTSQETLAETETKLAERAELEQRLGIARERQAELRAENTALKSQMDELKTRIDQLSAAEGATCPLCGQALSETHRKSTLAGLEKDGRSQGDRYRANLAEMKSLSGQIAEYEACVTHLAEVENQRLSASTTLTQLSERLEALQKQGAEWESQGARRLEEVTGILESREFAREARENLSILDQELGNLGYHVTAHEAARQAETQGRTTEAEYRDLEKARSAVKPIDDEIANLQSEIEKQKLEIVSQQAEYDQASEQLKASKAVTPDVEAAERALFDLRAQENKRAQELGAAAQLVNVLDDLRQRKADYISSREELLRQAARHKTLERAFGKDGVPALLIEQALPQIELRANELLDRLSDGAMSVRFVTQAEYKDKKRNDLKETLDIQISDGAGLRDYEMYSGGEAFRVNFAIRLALSEVLAQRKGARLQTLVIDEGFGSQDAQGRQRLIEAINLVKDDFARILVITHLEELKDAFPNRIEVEKSERGSSVKVV